MIRFCDTEVFNIIENSTSREDLDVCRCPDKLILSKDFWQEARAYFELYPKAFVLVVDRKGEMKGFAYDDAPGYYYIEDGLKLLKKKEAQAYFSEKYRQVQMIVIMDLNELAWNCYSVFSEMGYDICVIGEKWEWFGIKNKNNYLNYPDHAKFYIYAEGTDFTRIEEGGSHVRFKKVQNSFSFVTDFNQEMMKLAYREEINKLLYKGISVFECLVPNIVENKTELEETCIRKRVSLEKYCDPLYENKAEIEKYLFEMYGQENVKAILEEGGCVSGGKGRYIPAGEFLGQTVVNTSYDKRIYLIGPCIVGGYGCVADDSLMGKLQKKVDQFKYQVIALYIDLHKWDEWKKKIANIPIRAKDIVMIVNARKWFPAGKSVCNTIDVSPLYNDKNRKSMFCGETLHTNPEGNRILADYIYEGYLKKEILHLTQKQENFFLQKGELLQEDAINDIMDYTAKMKRDGYGNVGAIVMNCNPFTFGHKYLIEYAAGKVDFLYVFVVEEDRSFFEYQDRFWMVQKGTEELANVAVVPSGSWVLSYKTMPIYFEKEYKQDVDVDAYMDLEIFCRYIAPPLGIGTRFAGEEPFDLVTQQYNRQMEKVLGDFGIEFKEIRRLQMKNKIISASYVRKCMKKGKWEEIQNFIPEESYQVCLKYQDKISKS